MAALLCTALSEVEGRVHTRKSISPLALIRIKIQKYPLCFIRRYLCFPQESQGRSTTNPHVCPTPV